MFHDNMNALFILWVLSPDYSEQKESRDTIRCERRETETLRCERIEIETIQYESKAL